MIKILRRKFVIIIMSIVALILFAIFITLLITTKNNIERNSMEVLQQSLGREIDTSNRIPNPNKPPPNMRIPTLVVEDNGNTYHIIRNEIYYIDDTNIDEAIKLANDNFENFGIIKEYNLRFLKKKIDDSTFIAFVDTSVETRIIQDLVINSLLIGSAALVVFFILSIFFARWAVKPVEQAWDRQRQFVADASHELKTPLTVILTNTEMLASEKKYNEKDSKRIENIKEESLRMKKLVESLLMLARSDYVETSLQFSSVCLSDIVMDSVLLFESTIYDEGKCFEYDVEENIKVKGNPEKLRQLIDILLDNANKYTDKGNNITVKLSISQKKAAHLSVANEGELIPREELENIFRRFYRVDKSRANYGGFGLGLSIAESIVLEHKGKIWAESTEEKGNVFHVLFPCTDT